MAQEPYLGAIFMFAGNFAPKGYALCQGQLLPISQNAALFSILGTTFGGNGTTTFGLPDLRGRFPVGTGQGPGLSPVVLGQMAGVETVTLTISNLPAHTHILAAASKSGANNSPANGILAEVIDSQGGNAPAYVNPPGNVTMATAAVGLTGNNIPIGVQNPYLGMNFIIALVGIFPSRN